MLVEGKTGRERLCQNYDQPKHRCRVWDGAQPQVVIRHTAAAKKKAAVVAVAPVTPPPAESGKSEGK
jgi:hypothetical protein